MAGDSGDQTTVICSHCDRVVPSSNIELHIAHCLRNLEKRKVYGDAVLKKSAEQHFSSTHAPVSCSLCNETMDPNALDVHRRENCPQRIVICEYCQFLLPANDLVDHQEVCGNRTGLCHLCRKHIRLSEMRSHEARCAGVDHISSIAESTSRPPEMAGGAPRRQLPREISLIRLLLRIVMAGIAVLLSSLFFQRKPHQPSIVLN